MIIHCGSCAEASLADSEQAETNKRWRCTVYQLAKTRSGRAAQKRRRNVGEKAADLDMDGEETGGRGGGATTQKKKRKAPRPTGGGFLATLCDPAGSPGPDKVVVDSAR